MSLLGTAVLLPVPDKGFSHTPKMWLQGLEHSSCLQYQLLLNLRVSLPGLCLSFPCSYEKGRRSSPFASCPRVVGFTRFLGTEWQRIEDEMSDVLGSFGILATQYFPKGLCYF